MGLIYCYTSPENKKYIGQTKVPLNKRDKDHIKRSKNAKEKGTLFHQALYKFGRSSFILEILIECKDEELNDYEDKYVAEFNTIHPKGYNMRKGGLFNTIPSEIIREKISKGSRTKNFDLPMYMTRNLNKEIFIGYTIQNHPKLNNKLTFTKVSDPESMREKAQECLDYLNSLGENEENTEYLPKGRYRSKTKNNDLPKYMTRHYHGDKFIGYIIQRHPKIFHKQTFTSFTNPESMRKKAQECLDYLNNLGENEENTKYLPKSQSRRSVSNDLPKYVYRMVDKNGICTGYKVNTYKSDEPPKFFQKRDIDNFHNAIEYLTELMAKRMQLRD